MSGLFPGICNTQNVDKNGAPLAFSVLTVYQGGTLTLANCFQDIGLAIAAQNPMTATEDGRLPFFYVADGIYRVRLVDRFGVSVYDFPQVASIGASSSGGGGSAVDPTTIFQVGDPLWLPVAGTRTGWARMNGRTIGSATSGASERANADCQNLFLYNWATFSDALCPVSGGRGASAAADWAANKTIGMLDMRGRGPYGLASMANSASGVLTLANLGVDPDGAALAFGEEKHQLVTAELPIVTPAGSVSAPTITINGVTLKIRTGVGVGVGGVSIAVSPPNDTATDSSIFSSGSASASAPAFTGTPFGSGNNHQNMPPGRLGTWYQKL